MTDTGAIRQIVCNPERWGHLAFAMRLTPEAALSIARWIRDGAPRPDAVADAVEDVLAADDPVAMADRASRLDGVHRIEYYPHRPDDFRYFMEAFR